MRPIDADALMEQFKAYLHLDEKIDPDVVIDFIRAEPTISPPPNPPLTLEELREMDGEPVWVVPLILTSSDVPEDADIEEIKKAMEPRWVIRRHWQDTNHEYGLTYIAYRRKPEEVTS